ncbi:MAG: hypothetical protein FIB08_16155 [Candidatus Methanoperedens sp.]|nr:hypothetical protein [Candidatus Methanoperedens sp.]
METKDAFLVILPIIAALIGSYFTYYFTIKSKKSEAILKFKEEKYANLLILLQGFVGTTVSGEAKRKFFEEQYKSWLYCSDDVVKAINNMVQLVKASKGEKTDIQEGRKSIGNIVLAMRKDLLGKTNLNYNDFQYTDVIEDK